MQSQPALRALSIITGLSVLVASGFSIAGLINPQFIAGTAANQAASVFAPHPASVFWRAHA